MKINLLFWSVEAAGAKNINYAMLKVYEELKDCPKLQIIHLTGEQGYSEILKRLANKGINIEKVETLFLNPIYMKWNMH